MKRSGLILILFVATSIIEVSTPYWFSTVHLISKPLILISLIGYYFSKINKPQIVFVVGLFACLSGDTFLLFQKNDKIFFLLGLTSFLIAHILYSISYRQNRGVENSDKVLNVQKIRLAFPILLAGTGLIVYLYPILGDLKIPVVVYSIVLVVMVLCALSRYGRTSSISFWCVFIGAVFFMLSDSFLAINKFANPLPIENILVMGTYCIAQFLIVQGMINTQMTSPHFQP